MTIALVAVLVLLAAVAGALYHQCRRNDGLRAQLDAQAVDLQNLQDACSRLAPVGLVQGLIADGMKPGTVPAAEHKIVTVLFADLVGYTALSESMEPSRLARVLEGYFQRMSDAIHGHSGHISTFLGDGILAYFGAFHPNPWQCDDAVRAALAMQSAMAAYNAELGRDGVAPLAIGIGIHRGPGLVGLGGSRERLEYSFVGTTVNMAARVEALTRAHEVDILITEAVREELDPSIVLEPMPALPVKGVAEPVVTYAVRAMSTVLSTASD